MFVLFAVIHWLSSKPSWISGSESAQSHVAVFKLGKDGSFREKLRVPCRVPMSDFLTLTPSPFQVTLVTADGAMTSNVTVALRSPWRDSVDPVMLAFRRRYGPDTITEGTSVDTSYGVLPVPRSLGDQNERAVSLSTTMTFVVEKDTTDTPEGEPEMMMLPFKAFAVIAEEPERFGVAATASEALEMAASIVWPASA